jgi:hypothetical protein
MNKEQFHRYYKKLADSDDKQGLFSEYVIVYLIFHYYCLCCNSTVFRVFDKNGDGSIDFSEFVLAYASQVNKDVDSQLDLVFSM